MGDRDTARAGWDWIAGDPGENADTNYRYAEGRFDDPNSNDDCMPYQAGNALEQAMWEFTHGLNCFAEPWTCQVAAVNNYTFEDLLADPYRGPSGGLSSRRQAVEIMIRASGYALAQTTSNTNLRAISYWMSNYIRLNHSAALDLSFRQILYDHGLWDLAGPANFRAR